MTSLIGQPRHKFVGLFSCFLLAKVIDFRLSCEFDSKSTPARGTGTKECPYAEHEELLSQGALKQFHPLVLPFHADPCPLHGSLAFQRCMRFYEVVMNPRPFREWGLHALPPALNLHPLAQSPVEAFNPIVGRVVLPQFRPCDMIRPSHRGSIYEGTNTNRLMCNCKRA